MKIRQFNNNLLKQKTAIGSYLDQLLHEATQDSAESPVNDRVVSLVWEGAAIESELANPKKEISPNTEVIIGNAEDQQVTTTEAIPMSLARELFPLQCLMFWVAGNHLSVPLIGMKSVLPWTDCLTRLPGSPNWELGLLNYHQRNIRVVDSNQVLQIKHDADCAPAHVVVLGDEDWAITCDRLGNVVSLEYADIQWSQNQEEAMSYGTIRNSLASLLNPDAIIKRLSGAKSNQVVKNHSKQQ